MSLSQDQNQHNIQQSGSEGYGVTSQQSIGDAPDWREESNQHDDNESLKNNTDDDHYPQTSAQDLLPPADFQPFFALIQDINTGEHYHPSVHYVFTDDNHDFVTSAIVDTLEPGSDGQGNSDTIPRTVSKERIILLDIASDGKTITNSQSISPEWQVARTAIEQAPSWTDDSTRKTPAGLMLKVEGTSHRQKNTPQHIDPQEDAIARVEGIIAGYGDRLAALDRLIVEEEFNAGEKPTAEIRSA